MSVTNEDKNKAIPLTSPRAAPNPTAIPSRERATASETASVTERHLDWSISAFSGSAYTVRTNLKLRNENLMFLDNPPCFLITAFAMLSSSFTSPMIRRLQVSLLQCSLYGPPFKLSIYFIHSQHNVSPEKPAVHPDNKTAHIII